MGFHNGSLISHRYFKIEYIYIHLQSTNFWYEIKQNLISYVNRIRKTISVREL